ncbi:MAG: OmpA family protein [Thiobacillus sp.]
MRYKQYEWTGRRDYAPRSLSARSAPALPSPGAHAEGRPSRLCRGISCSDYLVGNGIAAERLTAQGYGETRPAYSNATREGRARNRRVELHVK